MGIEWLVLGLSALLWPVSTRAQPPFFPFGAPSIQADPPPPWNPGQVVRFSVTIDRFRAVERDGAGNILETQFFHGLGLEWADCWTEIELGEPPATRYTEEGFGGRWLAQAQDGPPARCNGLRRFAGFYFDGERTVGDRRIPLDGDAGNNYGDGLRDGPSLQGPWTFTWTARIQTCTGSSCSLDFQVHVLSDGETGSWSSPPSGCETGAQPPLTAASGRLAGNLQLLGSACLGQAVEIACLAPDGAERVRWRVAGAEILLEEACRVQLRWLEAGPKLVIRERLNGSGRVECVDTLRVVLNEPPRADFSLSANRICGSQVVEARLVGTEPARWRWRSEPPAIELIGEATHQRQFLWLEGGRGLILLEVYDEACNRWTATSREVLIDQPIESTMLEISSRVICTTDAVEVRAIAPSDVQLTFSLPGAAVGSALGAGPHQVFYQRSGQYGIVVQAQRGSCRRLALDIVRVLSRYTLSYSSPIQLCEPDTQVLPSQFMQLDSSSNLDPLVVIGWQPNEGLTPLAFGNVLIYADSTTTYRILTSNGACTAEAQIQVNVIPEIRIEGLPQETEHCLLGDAINLQADVRGGLPPYAYRWIPGSQLSDAYSPATEARPTRSTEYTLEVVDSAGCRQSASTFVWVQQVEILGFESRVNRCGPQSPAPELRVEVPADADFSYQWMPPEGLSCSDCLRPTVLDTANRRYEVLVTDRRTGCSGRFGPITFNYLQSLRAEAGNDARICAGSSVRLGADILQPAEVTYSWQPAASLDDAESPTPVASPDQTTSFTLTVSAAGCPPVTDTMRVEVVPAPEFRATSNWSRICAGDSVQLRLNGPLNLSGLRWAWVPNLELSSDTAASPWCKPSTSRTYTLQFQGLECPPIEPVAIELQVDPLPAIQIGSDSLLFCAQGGSLGLALPVLNLSGRAYTYQWEPTAGLDQPFSLTPRARPVAPVVYRLTARDPASGCQLIDSIWVGIGPQVRASLSWSDTTICRGDSVKIRASGGVGSASYWWQPVESARCSPCPDPWLQPERSTTFTVTAEEGGCTSTASARVQVVPRPQIDFQPSPERGCAPLTVTMAEYGQDIRSWYWDFGDGSTGLGPSPQHTYSKAGRYRVRLVATGLAGACVLTEPERERWVEVFEPPRAGIIWNGEPPPLADRPAIRLQATDSPFERSCHWDLGDGRWASGCEVWASWPNGGEVVVRLHVSDRAGCVDTASIRLNIAPAELSDLPTVFTPNGDGLNDIWQPVARTGQVLSVQIYDRSGREVFSGSGGWDGRLADGSEALPGTYTYLTRWNGRWYRGWLALLR